MVGRQLASNLGLAVFVVNTILVDYFLGVNTYSFILIEYDKLTLNYYIQRVFRANPPGLISG